MSSPIRIVAVGDLSFNGGYSSLLRRFGARRPFRFVLPAWRDADLRLGNLESPVTTAPRAAPCKLTLRAAPDAVASLRAAGFDCLTLANNHMMDYGPAGLAETRARLDAAAIPHAGAGRDADEAGAPALLRRRGQTVGVLGFCLVEQKSPLYAGSSSPGVAALHVEEAVRRIRELRRRVDWVVVQAHWGVELSRLPAPEQREWARRMAEAGADLILGHHPHVLQPTEIVAGVPVYYSLGNFFFSEMYWRGNGPDGAPFLSKLRIPRLARRTGWAEVVLERGKAATAHFRPARLRADLAVQPAPTAGRRRDWEALCATLQLPDYEARAAAEACQARVRIERQDAWRPLLRRLEMRLYDRGLLPSGVEGD